jgi:hypothetical protein
MPPNKPSDSESMCPFGLRVLMLYAADIYCWFCQPGLREKHSNRAFSHHMNTVHNIESYLLYTPKAFGVQCRVIVPYTLNCPYTVCNKPFQNPTDKNFGRHLRRDHAHIDLQFKESMERGKYFWWTTEEVDGECTYQRFLCGPLLIPHSSHIARVQQ